jgi:Fe-Mn family superoxide dismutase
MTTTRAIPFQLPPLPYAATALEPLMSARALGFHYAKHHKAYVDSLNNLVADEAEMASMGLEELIRATADDASKARIFDNAAQAWNHTFFWSSMKPAGGGKPTGRIADALDASFGNYGKFRAAFTTATVMQFGSGWAWLIADGGKLAVVKTQNAATPMAHGKKCLLALDLWEHAYYFDYQNRRPDYVGAYLDHLVNWEFAEKNLG